MKADTLKVLDFLKKPDTQMVVPVYQRNYVWSIRNCEKLWDDAHEALKLKKPHFIGSIVYITQEERTSSEISEFVIIDGQQRLTTVTLLLLAIYHHYKNTDDQRKADPIANRYLINPHFEDANRIKLRGADASQLFVAKQLQQDVSNHPEFVETNACQNYCWFRDQLTSKELTELAMDSLDHLYTVEIKLKRGEDDPQRIFESLNSTGEDLLQADLVRNYLLMGLKANKQEHIYNSYWAKIEKNTTLKVEQAGPIKHESVLQVFVRDYCNYKLRSEKLIKIDQVYQYVKSHLLPNHEEAPLEVFVKELLHFSQLYYWIKNPNASNFGVEVKKQLKYIQYLQINTSNPLMLYLLNEAKPMEGELLASEEPRLAEQELAKCLILIQNLYVRRQVCGLGTNALNKIYAAALRNMLSSNHFYHLKHSLISRTSMARFPSDDEFTQYLQIFQLYEANRLPNYLFELLEHKDSKENIDFIFKSAYSIEHIYPQKDSAWDLPQAEKQYIKDTLVHTIGNLTITGYNSELSNKPFAEKKTNTNHGFNQSNISLNRQLGKYLTWDADTIRARCQDLTSKLISIFPYPQIVAIPNNQWQSIYEINTTHLKVKGVRLAIKPEESNNIDSYSQLYKWFLKELDVWYPDWINNGEILKIVTGNPNSERGFLMHENIRVDNNLSSKSIIKCIIRILSLAQIKPDIELYLAQKDDA